MLGMVGLSMRRAGVFGDYIDYIKLISIKGLGYRIRYIYKSCTEGDGLHF